MKGIADQLTTEILRNLLMKGKEVKENIHNSKERFPEEVKRLRKLLMGISEAVEGFSAFLDEEALAQFTEDLKKEKIMKKVQKEKPSRIILL
ncbi:hypothetical protein KKH36_01900 [Patescibacteria group bacterium]|nr:hypothetical protein [Patescibacteria group bacterium]